MHTGQAHAAVGIGAQHSRAILRAPDGVMALVVKREKSLNSRDVAQMTVLLPNGPAQAAGPRLGGQASFGG